MVRVLVIDNYDSFVHNIAQYLGEMGAEVTVLRNDETIEKVREAGADLIVLSPGPGHPRDSRVCLEILETLSKEIPTLGVCLGHQALFHVYGGRIEGAADLRHGKTSGVYHEGGGILRDIPSPFTACRYHSLVAANGQSVPECLEVIARTDSGEIMAARHREHPIHGLQFHPESILTPHGKKILRNFLEEAL